MKNLEKLGVTEIHKIDLTTIDGGNWWDDLVDAVDEAVEAVGDAFDALVDSGVFDPLIQL